MMFFLLEFSSLKVEIEYAVAALLLLKLDLSLSGAMHLEATLG